jgi:hypothetical protein
MNDLTNILATDGVGLIELDYKPMVLLEKGLRSLVDELC